MIEPKEFQDLLVKVARMEEKICASDKAVVLALQQLSKWQENANEWRGALRDVMDRYATKSDLVSNFDKWLALHDVLCSRVDFIEKRHIAEAGGNKSMNNLFVKIVSIIGVVSIIITLIMKFVKW